MTFRLGLTGSIGMGKSTTARMFQEEGCALWDADATVHRLYAKDGAAVPPLKALFPDIIEDEAVSREKIKAKIARNESVMREIEKIVHPLVAKDKEEFLQMTKADIVVLDIPLLFEGGYDTGMNAVVVVTIDPEEQRRRLLERGGMTLSQLDRIMSKQIPDFEKRARADYVIVTDTKEHARDQVRAVVKDIRQGPHNA